VLIYTRDIVTFDLPGAAVIATVQIAAAESLGAGSVRVLLKITLPLLMPALGAAAGLAVALSMGELGATVMVYPATWKTLPVTIFALTDRGQAFQAAACTTILLLVTLLALVLLGRIRGRAALR
jgi:2-aminoethylphosphonate transport system permease protein